MLDAVIPTLLTQLFDAALHVNVLSVNPFNVMPPPSAVTSVGDAVDPNSRFLSSTVIVVELIVVINPFTDKFPSTYKLPPIPTPPATFNAPVIELDDAVVLGIDNAP
jgi:hypothetical protein